MFPIKNYLVLLTILLSLIACSGGGGGDGGTTNTPGNANAMPGLASCATTDPSQTLLCGTAVATDGVTPLAGAEISMANFLSTAVVIAAVADPARCLTDDQGEFACVVPSGITGDIDFVIETQGFADVNFTVNIMDGMIIDAGQLTMTADASTVWVVMPGFNDGVQVLLAQLKNCTLSSPGGGDYNPMVDFPADARGSQDCVEKGLIVLDDNDFMSPYYAPVYLASNSLSTADALFINCDADLSGQTAVNDSISRFVSNGGHVYFSDQSDTWLTSLFPGKINFLGNETDVGTISGSALHTGLASVVGTNFDVVFDLGVWTAINNVAAGVTTFVEGDITSVSFFYTGVHPITVGWRENATSGCVYYTSYHIEGNSSGAAQELAIKYLIQNIGAVCT